MTFAGQTWIVLNPATGYLLMQGKWGSDQEFDSSPNYLPAVTVESFDPSDSYNIAYYLNNSTVSGGVYSTLSSSYPADAALIQTHAWTIGGDNNESSGTPVEAKIGLLSLGEYNEYQSLIEESPLINDGWWTLTPYSFLASLAWDVTFDGSLDGDPANTYSAVRPALYLNPDILVSGGNGGNVTTTLGPPAAPTITPEGGSSLTAAQTVTIANNTSNGDNIYYTTDGSLPTLSDPYSVPFQVNQTETVNSAVYDTVYGMGNASSVLFTFAAAPALTSVNAQAGTVSGDTAILVTKNSGSDTLAVQVSGTELTTPNEGDSPPSGAGVTSNYTSGSNLPAAAGDWVGVYELNGSGTVDAFGQIQLTAGDIYTASSSAVNGGGSPPPLLMTTTSLPAATLGQPYSQIIATNNTPYTFSVTSGTLPDGLTLSSAGALSGTPTTTGSYSFTVTVEDVNGNSANESYTLTINSAAGSTVVSPSLGGTVAFGAEVSMDIPAGALQGSAAVGVTIQSDPSPPAAPDGYTIIGAYEFTVGGQDHYTFNSPVTLTFHFNPSKVPKGTTPAVYYYNGTRWVLLTGTVDWTTDTITVTVDHFTQYAVMAEAPATAPASPTATLTDIAGNWAKANIEKLVGLGAITGYPDGTFRPNNDITRAEFATVLVKALKLTPKAGPVFADTEGTWAQSYVSTAAVYGIVSGYDASHFGPNDLITREQMTAMVVRAAKLAPVSGPLPFTDAAQIAPWAREDVLTAVKDGIIHGYPDGTFRPLNHATRAEAATVIVRILK